MSEPIHALVFSKDRAMQLDAFLRSAERHMSYASISVQWAASNDVHLAAYVRVGDEWPGVHWHNDRVSLEASVRFFLADRKRVAFHTDDELFLASPPAWLTEAGPGVVPTFRQGRNTIWCEVLSLPQAIPDTFPLWRWKDAGLDFGYPLSLNACVYRSADILPLLDFSFQNPTQLEAGLAARADRFGPQFMVAPEHSCTVALPHNVVSADSNCPRGSNPEWQPDALCRKYLDGWRIDLDAMDFSSIVAAHQEVPLIFRRVT